MIVIRFKGALGNQMFEYATAKRLALHRNTELQIDLSGLKNTPEQDTPRHYELDCFMLKAKEATLSNYELININQSRKSKLKHFLKKINRNKLWVYSSGSNLFDPKVLSLPSNTLLDGWFTSERYFRDIRPTLLKDFSYRKPPSKINKATLNNVNNANSVSLHVRRGDYITNRNANIWHGVLEKEYYTKAVKIIADKVSNPEIFVFSNDPEWCKRNMKFNHKTHYIDNNDDLNNGSEDMRLMRACKHNIIANSTFSWWGAWLNDSPGKIVISPKQWFKEGGINDKDIVPAEWLRI